MLYYDRTDASEGIDINKTSESKEPDICHYLLLFKFHSCVCNRCHDLVMMSTNLSDIAILKIKSVDYCRNWGYKVNVKHQFDLKMWNFIKYENLLSHVNG